MTLVIPSVPFPHIYERGSNGPSSLMKESWWGQVSFPEPIVVMGQGGCKALSRGKTIITIPGKREKGIHWQRRLRLSLKEDIISQKAIHLVGSMLRILHMLSCLVFPSTLHSGLIIPILQARKTEVQKGHSPGPSANGWRCYGPTQSCRIPD